MNATKWIMAGAVLILMACGNKEKEYDATGVFEAVETTVFAEQSGTLLTFDVNEGDVMTVKPQVIPEHSQHRCLRIPNPSDISPPPYTRLSGLMKGSLWVSFST